MISNGHFLDDTQIIFGVFNFLIDAGQLMSHVDGIHP